MNRKEREAAERKERAERALFREVATINRKGFPLMFPAWLKTGRFTVSSLEVPGHHFLRANEEVPEASSWAEINNFLKYAGASSAETRGVSLIWQRYVNYLNRNGYTTLAPFLFVNRPPRVEICISPSSS